MRFMRNYYEAKEKEFNLTRIMLNQDVNMSFFMILGKYAYRTIPTYKTNNGL